MPKLPLHPAAVYGVVKEIKAAAEDQSPLVVAGAHGPAGELVSALGEGGDPSALRNLSGSEVTPYDLQGSALLVYVVEGEKPTQEDEAVLKLADRNDVQAVCLLVGAKSQPLDVPCGAAASVGAAPPGKPIPIGRVAELIASLSEENAYWLAA